MGTSEPSRSLIEAVRALGVRATGVELRRARKGETADALATRFGGSPYAERGEAWPICGGCESPLSFVGQFDLDRAPSRGALTGLYSFYYCQECASWGDIPADLKDAWVVRRHATPAAARACGIAPPSEPSWIARPCLGELAEYLSLPDYEDASLPKSVIPKDVESPWELYEAACQAVRGSEGEPTTKIGGFPSWIQGSSIPECESCKSAMSLVAEIGSEDQADIMWGDMGSVYLFDCCKHPGRVRMTLQCF